MQQVSGITVEEVDLEQWLQTAFRAERAPRPCAARPRVARQPTAKKTVPRFFGARPLYWIWLAGAALSLLLQGI